MNEQPVQSNCNVPITLSSGDLPLVCTLAHAWGDPAFGPGNKRPSKMPTLVDRLLCCCCAGALFHSPSCRCSAQVYAWGNNAFGQLGLGDKRPRKTPTLVDGLWALPVAHLAAGAAHSAAVTAAGFLFTWGANSRGQLGLPAVAEVAAHHQVSGWVLQNFMCYEGWKAPFPARLGTPWELLACRGCCGIRAAAAAAVPMTMSNFLLLEYHVLHIPVSVS